MKKPARLCLTFHNHQPVGNFDWVFEQAYQDSYLPFLDTFEPFEQLKISLHSSGPLMLWLAEEHPEYLNRVRELCKSGRIEILGGPMYEPIMTMLPPRDAVGQIQAYASWIRDFFGVSPRGMWLPERVWEPQLTSILANAGIEYTILDDFHFKSAGLCDEELYGYFLTEDNGKLLRVFAGSESLRYRIPFQAVDETIDYCQAVAEQFPDSILTFGDDGEKFGSWPGTKEHVYDGQWLRNFFQTLSKNQHWLRTMTLSEAVSETRPLGKIYLPNSSYREMTEWSLQTEQQERRQGSIAQLAIRFDHEIIRQGLPQGFWRNFKTKYSETSEMYARMMYVSHGIEAAITAGVSSENLEVAKMHLYQGQCNCSYWHGAFGGVYLPHLRDAIYKHLIAAEKNLDQSLGRQEELHWQITDFDFDGNDEIMVRNAMTSLWIAPSRGGSIYEMDIYPIEHNLLATLQRRREIYHQKVLDGPKEENDDLASIHDRVVFKQPNLDQHLIYDTYPRKSLVDHFHSVDTTIDAIKKGTTVELGDFVDEPYDSTVNQHPERLNVRLHRQGKVMNYPLDLSKSVQLERSYNRIRIGYNLENISADAKFIFSPEFNFSGLPSDQEDRFFSDLDGNRLGHLGTTLDLQSTQQISLSDQWLGIDIQLSWSQPSGLWAYPVQSVSQSESGFELVHQSVCVMPYWIIDGQSKNDWDLSMEIKIVCESGESDKASP
jgi:alpha-amylase